MSIFDEFTPPARNSNPAGSGNGVRLTLITLNVWGLPEPFARDVSARMDAIAAHLCELDTDIVNLQEVWLEQVRARLLTEAVRKHYPWVWHDRGEHGGGGLLVLSRYPILEVYFEPYLLKGLPYRLDHADYYAGKGFVHLRLATGNNPVSLVNTHLHAQYTNDVGNQYLGVRAGQVVQLAAYLAGIRDPLLVAGDFNTHEGAPVYRILRELGGIADTAATLDRRDMTVRRANPYRQGKNSPDSRKDYLFYRNGRLQSLQPISIERVFDQQFLIRGRTASFSNHDGVLAEFQLTDEASSPSATPDPQIMQLALRLLEGGRHQTEERQGAERGIAAAAVTAGALGPLSQSRERLNRRRFLKRSMVAFPVVAVPSGAGFLALSELHRPAELKAYGEVIEMLETKFGPASTC